MKNKITYSIGSIIILLIAAFIFVLVPAVASKSESGASLPPYGYYNNEPVKFDQKSEFYNLASQMVRYMEAQGYDFNAKEASFYYSIAFNQAFNQVVGPMALRDMTKATGWAATDTAVDRSLIRQYYSESGEYSQALYNATPDEAKREYQTEVVNTLTAARSYQDLFGSLDEVGGKKMYGMKASSNEIEYLRKMGTDLHSFEYVTFSMTGYPAEEIAAYGKTNSETFTKYDLSVISVADEAKAKDVLKRINNSEITFDDAITSYSDKTFGDSETGKINQNYRYQLADSITDSDALNSIITLTTGSLSPVIKTNTGYAVFRCDGEPVNPDFTDQKTLADASGYIYSREKGRVEEYFSAIAKDFIAEATTTSFKAASEKAGLQVTEIPAMALNFNNTTIIGKSSLDEFPGLRSASVNENFLTKAFALQDNDISSPIVMSNSNLIVVLHSTGTTAGGTSEEDAGRLITPEIATADSVAVNTALQNSNKIKSNSAAFMKAFTGGRF